MADETAEAFQRAAVELLGAARAFLDAAEAVVRDPTALGTVAASVTGVMRSMGEAVIGGVAGLAEAARAAGSPGSEPADGSGSDGLERIDLG
jgi:hypothetical protein